MESKKRLLFQSVLVLLSIISGTIVGVYFPKVSHAISPFGSFYFQLLQMCVIPIIICALISYMGKCVASPLFRMQIKKILLWAIGISALMGLLGLGLGVGGKSAFLSLGPRVEMGKFLFKVESHDTSGFLAEGQVEKFPTASKVIPEKTEVSFLQQMIPANVFVAFINEQMLQIIFFSLFLGLALGFISHTLRSSLFKSFTVFLETFDQIVDWLRIIFPLGIFCALSEEISQEGKEVLSAFLPVFFLYLGAVLVLFLVNMGVLAWKTKNSVWKTILSLRETIIVAFGSSSKFVAMPFALEELMGRFKAKKDVVYLLLPLSLTLFPYGTIFTFSFLTTFLLIFYKISLTLGVVSFLIFGSILAAITFSGQGGDDPSSLPLPLLSTLFMLLGFTTGGPLAVFTAFFPLLLPLSTVMDVCFNCSMVAIPEHHREMHPMLVAEDGKE